MRRYLALARAEELLPIKPSAPALWRWCVKGVQVRRANKATRLQHAYVGRRLMGFPGGTG